MGLIKIVTALLPFIKELLTGNKEARAFVNNNKIVLTLSSINLAIFAMFLFAYNVARDAEFRLMEVVIQRDQYERRYQINEEYYRTRYEDQLEIFADSLKVKDEQIAFYKSIIESHQSTCLLPRESSR